MSMGVLSPLQKKKCYKFNTFSIAEVVWDLVITATMAIFGGLFAVQKTNIYSGSEENEGPKAKFDQDPKKVEAP